MGAAPRLVTLNAEKSVRELQLEAKELQLEAQLMKMEVKMAELEREREEMHKTLGVNPNPEEASKAVLAANDKFYEAYSAAKLSDMKKIWSQKSDAVVIFTGKPVITSFADGMHASWRCRPATRWLSAPKRSSRSGGARSPR